MSAERRAEAPQGFTWHHFEEMNAWFLVPDGWFTRQETKGSTDSCFISSEPGGNIHKVYTGLTVNRIPHFNSKSGISPGKFAKDMITQPTHPMQAVGDAVYIQQEPFAIYRRVLKSTRVLYTELTPRQAISRSAEPIMFYMEMAANIQTGTLYILHFESPVDRWAENEALARLIVETRILDPRA